MELARDQLDITVLKNQIIRGSAADRSSAAMLVAGTDRVADVVRELLDSQPARRWMRRELLPLLDPEKSARVARLLVGFSDDFVPTNVDRSTELLIDALSESELKKHSLLLAGSNAAEHFWRRLSRGGEDDLLSIAMHVMKSGEAQARESTLHLLALDPYGPGFLSNERQVQLLRIGLADDDLEIRGLAAEALAAEQPAQLLDLWESAPEDRSERFRMAFWRVAFAAKPGDTAELAAAITLNSAHALDVRRTALLALGENVSTRVVAPVLIGLLQGHDSILAQDAAELMWRYHRAPDIAAAAAESDLPSVRERAEWLLHPERGSPAAGGSRPGDPTRPGAVFDQISDSGW